MKLHTTRVGRTCWTTNRFDLALFPFFSRPLVRAKITIRGNFRTKGARKINWLKNFPVNWKIRVKIKACRNISVHEFTGCAKIWIAKIKRARKLNGEGKNIFICVSDVVPYRERSPHLFQYILVSKGLLDVCYPR